MSLKVTICVSLSDDCTTAYFFETTGLYDAVTNPTGYGAPNYETIEFTTATLAVTLAGSTVAESPIDIFGGLLFPSTVTTRAWQVNASDFGLTTFPTGLTRFTYNISGKSGETPIGFKATTLILADCDLQCCLDKKKLVIAKNPATCSCDDDRVSEMLYVEALLEAAHAATCCGDVASVNSLIAIIKKKCNDCGCGCS